MIFRPTSLALSVLISLVLCKTAQAKDFYVDPKIGSSTGDGSATRPWRTLQEVIEAKLIESQNWSKLPYVAGAKLAPRNAGAPVKAGDTLWLRSGYHGVIALSGYYNAKTITIAAQVGHHPKFKSVQVRSSSNWTLRGLWVSPAYAPHYAQATLIKIESDNFHGPIEKITVEGCHLQSVADASTWSVNDWNKKSCNGISASGTQITIRDNTLRNVNFGISVSATHSMVDHNTVENFAGDGMRGLGDYTVFQYNTVKNCYKVNANHDDGFQSWSVGKDGKVGTGEVTGIVLRGNRIINYEDPKQPFRGPLQGFGLFDGTYVDWTIENNVIITDHWHGITLLGARGCRVINNTVIDPNTVKPGPPWIRIDAHKDGTPPSGCIVRNNLATAFTSAKTGVTEDHNLKVANLAATFVDPAAYDLHLLPSSPAIDKGSSTFAPKVDIEGTPRPQGKAVDVGAYEWSSSPPKVDASPTSDASSPDASSPDASLADAAPIEGGASPHDGLSGAADGAPKDRGLSFEHPVDETGPLPEAPSDAGGCACTLDSSSTQDVMLVPFLALFFFLRRRRVATR